MFSSVPGSQAQVLNNVNAGMRAFWLGGQRGQFDGVDMMTDEKRFVAVGQKQATAARNMYEARFTNEARGTTLEFCLQPSLTVFGQQKKHKASLDLSNAAAPLAADFARSLGVLAAVHSDLKRLAVLGDLAISEPRPGWLAVRFPGCDGSTVESLCSELGICRGVIREDEAWGAEFAQDVKMALLFPSAPSEDQESCVDAHFYSIQPDAEIQSLNNPSYTADETLSPLESIGGSASPVQDSDLLSLPTISGVSNPWLDESRFSTRSRDSDQNLHQGGRINQGHDADSMCIMRFLAECDSRLTR